jgi:glutaredoxin
MLSYEQMLNTLESVRIGIIKREEVVRENAQLVAENDRLRNRIAKLQSLGAVDVEALHKERERLSDNCVHLRKLLGDSDRDGARETVRLRGQIDELTKHNHALSERAKRAEGSFTAPYVTINGFHYYLGESK